MPMKPLSKSARIRIYGAARKAGWIDGPFYVSAKDKTVYARVNGKRGKRWMRVWTWGIACLKRDGYYSALTAPTEEWIWRGAARVLQVVL